MKIEIWSDIICPWCYVGKRRFEAALQQFEYADQLEVEYKSYQLNPDMETDPQKNIHQYLSENKGISIQEAEQMTAHVSEVAKTVGLDYRLEEAIPVNTFKAHRLLHLAKEKGKQAELKEALLHAYFIQTKNIDDHATLLNLAKDVGLEELDIQNVLTTDLYKANVQSDIYEGIQLGLQGVPFFVFNRKYGIAGAQPTEAFLNTLKQSFEEAKEA